MMAIEITTIMVGLGSLASTQSRLGHHKQVDFPRRAAHLLLTIPFLAHRSTIQDTLRQSSKIVQNLHLIAPPGLIPSDHLTVDFSLQKNLEDLILCAVVETLIRAMGFHHLMTSRILLGRPHHLGHHWTVKLQGETRTLLALQHHLGHHLMVKLQEETQTLMGLQVHLGHHSTVKLLEEIQTLLARQRHLGHHSMAKLQEETQTHMAHQVHLGHHLTVLQEQMQTLTDLLLHSGHHSTVKLQEEIRTISGPRGLLDCQWRVRLQEKTLIIGVHFSCGKLC